MASSSLLRSAVRELRRSIFRPPRLATPLMEGSRLLTTDGAGKKTSPPSSPPNATQFQLRLENPLRSNCADSVETIKKLQVAKDELMAYKRYLLEKKKETDMDYLLTLDQFSDTMEERSSLLRQIKEILEAKNKRSAEMYRHVRQRALLISYSSVFALALYNLYLFS